MKHSSLLLLFAAAVITGCSDSTLLPEAPALEVGSRAIVTGAQSENNPTLLTDWENCSTIYLNEVSGSGRPIAVTAPWENGAPTSLSGSFCQDVQKADGWIMLFHTFKRADEEPRQSYMCFYNQFTGYIKVFYYVRDANSATESVWNVASRKTSDTCPPMALFSDNEYFSQPLAGDDNFSVWSITANNPVNSGLSAISFGWNGFEFRVGEYNPKNSDGVFVIRAYNTTYTDYNFNGEESSATTGTISTINTDDSSVAGGALAKAVINQTGAQAKNFIDKFAEKNLNKSFLGLNFKDILAKVTAGDYAGAITSGLGFVFKSFIKKAPTYSISDVKLQTQGTITLKGTSSSQMVACVESMNFDLKEVIAGGSNPKLELGVWNLKKKPTIYYGRYTEFTNEGAWPEFYPGCTLDVVGTTPEPEMRVGDVEVVFNPAIAQYVKSYSVKTGMIDVLGGNRTLDNNRKPMVYYVTANLLTDNNGIRVYGVTKNRKHVDGLMDTPQDVELSENTRYYIDWGDNIGGYRAAVVTLTMTVNYNGREWTFTESRVYDVVYAPEPTNERNYNTPPATFILNQSRYPYYGFRLY